MYMYMNITKDVLYILNRLDEEGFEGYIVGGCVRDSLMGKLPHDYDVATNALPSDIKRIFRRTVDTGIKHGTVTVLINGESYEITTYRIDGEYTDGRHPERVYFTDKITEDLSRRDFTMNAIAYNPDLGCCDPFGGRDDIKNGIIRGVRDPDLRFKEDALRMLRCIRFSAQLGFETEENTLAALKNNAELIKNVSAERISAEFLKLITSEHTEKAMLLVQTGLGDFCLPAAAAALRERGDEICRLLKSAVSCEEALAIVYAKTPCVREKLKALRLSNDLIGKTLPLIKYYDAGLADDDYGLRRLLSEIGKQSFLSLVRIKKAKGEKNIAKAESFAEREAPITRADLDINGKDIGGLGFEGRAVGDVFEGLLDFVLKNPKNNKRDILLKEALKWLH